MAGLIPLATAKTHLRITDDLHDADVQLKLDQAEAVILDYLKLKQTGEPRPDWPWMPTTLPKPVEAAMLIMLTFLYEARGDEPEAKAKSEDVWKTVDDLVIRFRDPAIA